jgi:hypothetical protein
MAIPTSTATDRDIRVHSETALVRLVAEPEVASLIGPVHAELGHAWDGGTSAACAGID